MIVYFPKKYLLHYYWKYELVHKNCLIFIYISIIYELETYQYVYIYIIIYNAINIISCTCYIINHIYVMYRTRVSTSKKNMMYAILCIYMQLKLFLCFT